MREQALSQAAEQKSQSHYGANVAIAGVECERRHVFINSKGAKSGKRAEQDWRKGNEYIGSRCVVSSGNKRLCRANGGPEETEEHDGGNYRRAPVKEDERR